METYKSEQANINLKKWPDIDHISESESKPSQSQTKTNIDGTNIYLSKHLEVT